MTVRPGFIALLLTISLPAILLFGCGGNNHAPIAPQELKEQSHAVSTPTAPPANIKSWGTWLIHCVDQSGNTPESVEAIPLREGDLHLDVIDFIRPPMCTNCMHLSLVSHVGLDWTIKVSLTNPTIQTAYDVTGVFPGMSGPHITDFDSYTDMFDIDGFSDTHNPFKCFETGDPTRKWGPGETHDQTFTFHRDPGEKFTDLIYVVAISWPDNALGIISLTDPQAGGPLYTDESHPVDFTVNVLDWQNDVEYVVINLAPINGSAYTPMVDAGDGVYKYEGYTSSGLQAGTSADLMIAAKSLGAGYLTYNFCHVEIIDPPPPPTNFKVVSGPATLSGSGKPSGDLDLAIVGQVDKTSSTFVNASDTDVYAWNESYSQSDLLVSIVDPSGTDPDYPIAPVSRLAFPNPPDPTASDKFAILQTNLDTREWDNSTTPPILYKDTLRILDLETLSVIDFKLTADNPDTAGIDAIARPIDVSRGVNSDKAGYALWIPDSGVFPTYYPYAALVRYLPPYKDATTEYDQLIGGVLLGDGDGKLLPENITGLAVWDGGGDSNIIIAISVGGTTPKVEIFSIDYTANPVTLFTPIKTLTGLAGTPIDLAILPVKDAGFEDENWLCILTDSGTVETYTFSGTFVESFMDPDALPAKPVHIDTDVANLRIHVMMEGPIATVIEYKTE